LQTARSALWPSHLDALNTRVSTRCCRQVRDSTSDPNPLDLIERDFVAAPVVEAGRARALVIGHLLRDLELAPVLEVSRDAGGAKSVAADFGLDPGRQRPPTNHAPHIGLHHRPVGQLAGTPLARAEERTFALLRDASRGDVFLKVAVEIVVRRHLVLLAAFLVKTDPAAAPLHKVVLDLHRDRRAHPREGVDHQADQGAIAQAGKGIGVDRVDQGAGLVGLQHRRLTPPLRVLRPPYRGRGIHGHDLADHHPVEEHAQRGQPLLHRGPRVNLELCLHKGRHMEGLDLAEIHDAVLGAEGGDH
jgi:hypothetical protein